MILILLGPDETVSDDSKGWVLATQFGLIYAGKSHLKLQGEAYRGLGGTSSASASDVAGSVCPGASVDGTPLVFSAEKLALKF